ncbi:MAG: glycosyltransferase [Planctomycetota bacterium]
MSVVFIFGDLVTDLPESRLALTVLMPVLAPDPRYFPAAVLSILEQTRRDFELLIIEDPSDRSGADQLAGLKDDRIRHVQNPRRTSLVEQLNQGLDLARGDLVARMDADDLAEPDRLQVQSERFERDGSLGVIGSQLAVIDGEDRLLGYREYPCNHEEILACLPRFNPLAHPTVMFRRKVVQSAGGYRDYPMCEDYELWSRLAIQGVRFANHPRPLLRYRVHPGASKSTRLRGMLRGTLKLKEQYYRGRMDGKARARLWGERILTLLPASMIMGLFLRMTLKKRLPLSESDSSVEAAERRP